MIRRNGKFSSALKRAMKTAGVTRADLARQLEVGRTTVYGWLSGSEPTDPNFEKLVSLFPELAEFRR